MYDIAGRFIEACDCYSLCPCWVAEDPDDGHCTGLFAWSIDAGTIDGAAVPDVDGDDDVDVSGRLLVSVSTHGGNRRGGGQVSVLFIDDGASDDERAALRAAFTGDLGGALAELREVMGTVLDVRSADIAFTADDSSFALTVGALVEGAGTPLAFDGGEPMQVRHTALDKELQTTGAVTAQHTTKLKVNVPTLPADYVEVTDRSGMTGAFAYAFAG